MAAAPFGPPAGFLSSVRLVAKDGFGGPLLGLPAAAGA